MLRVLKASLPFVVLAAVILSLGYVRELALEGRLTRAEGQIVAARVSAVSAADLADLRAANSALSSQITDRENRATLLQQQLTAVQQTVQSGSTLTLTDVQNALNSGRLSVPASSISTPIVCSGRPAAWSFFGLAC
jgi:hypothetical protein